MQRLKFKMVYDLCMMQCNQIYLDSKKNSLYHICFLCDRFLKYHLLNNLISKIYCTFISDIYFTDYDLYACVES